MNKYASLRRDWKIVYSGDIVEVYEYRVPINVDKREYNIIKGTKKDEGKREDNLYRARTNIRRYIWNNITPFSKFITLTYENTCLDEEQVQYDFKQFIKKLKRKLNKNITWLYVTEHQKDRGIKENNSGSLHIHAVLFVDDFIPHEIIYKCWGKGNTDIHAIDKVNNMGAYVCKYLTKEEFNLYEKNCYHISRGLKKSKEIYHDSYIGVEIEDLYGILDNVEFYHQHTSTYEYPTADGVFKNSVIYRQGKIIK